MPPSGFKQETGIAMTSSLHLRYCIAGACILGAASIGLARQSEQKAPAAPSAPAAATAAPVNNPPPFEQVTPALDFGYRTPLAFEQGIITLVNMGEEPLKITAAHGECACTVVTANKDVVQPGESVDLLVGLEIPPELGLVSKKVVIDVEGFQFPFITAVRAESGLPVRVNNGGQTSIVVDLVGKMTLESVEGRPFQVIAINGKPPIYFDFDPEKDRPRTQYVVGHDFSDLAAIDLPRRVIVETDHPGARMIDVQAMLANAYALSLPHKWRPVRDHLVMGSIPMNEPSMTYMVMAGKPLIPGQKFTCRARGLDARVDIVGAHIPAEGGGILIDLKVTPRGGFQGFLHTIVDITLEGDATALEIFARVAPKDQIPPDAVLKHH